MTVSPVCRFGGQVYRMLVGTDGLILHFYLILHF